MLGNHELRGVLLAIVSFVGQLVAAAAGEQIRCGPDGDGRDKTTELQGKFPSFDGDSFSFKIPERCRMVLGPREAFCNHVAPLMRVMGFGSRIESIVIPDSGLVFQQTELGVPIETAVIVVTPTTVHGTLYKQYRITNVAKLSATAAIRAASQDRVPLGQAELVLLPDRGAAAGIDMHYTYRTLLADRLDKARTWQAWIDAESGRILKLTPQFEEE